MKLLLTTYLLILSTYCFSQKNDELVFFRVNNDSVIFYIDKIGDITTNFNASFYRIASLNKEFFTYSGNVRDFYNSNEIAYECNYANRLINGKVISYFKNSHVKYSGYFKDSKKDSIWTFFYDNGQIEKIVHFKNNEPLLMEYYKKNGKPVFTNGNGKYSGTIIAEFKQPYEYKISGNIINGSLDGKWSWSDNFINGVDIFENGKYIKSQNTTSNFNNQQLVTLLGFDLHESVDLYKFIAIPKTNKTDNKDVIVPNIPVRFESSDFETPNYFNLNDPNNQPLKFNGSVYLNKTFSKTYSDYLSDFIKKNNIKYFWCFVQFTVNESSSLEKIFVYSNIELITKSITSYLSEIKGFQTVIVDKLPISCKVYISTFCNNGQFNIPDYNYNNQTFNIQDVLF